MTRWAWIAAGTTLCLAAVAAALALQAARRDRNALVSAFAAEHRSRLSFAVQGVESDLEDVPRDLAFAARLVEGASSADDRARELRALLAVVRAYRMVVVFDGDGRQQLAVVDPFAPTPWSTAPFERAFAETAHRAVARGGLAFSALVEGPASPWYRVLAIPLSSARSGAVAVAILVDLRDAFARLGVLAPGSAARVIVLDPDGQPAPMTPASFAAGLGAAASPAVRALVSGLRSGADGWVLLTAAEAAALGMARTEAVAAYAAVRDGPGARWGVAVVEPTTLLRSKEREITLQLAAVGTVLALGLSLVSAFLVAGARREIAMTERLRAAEELVRAEKLATVGVLAAGIAHEIGTPLSVVRGRAERIGAKLGADHPLAESSASIVQEIDRVSRIIRELLDYSRPSRATAVPVSLASVARRALQLLDLEAQARRVTLALDVPPALPAVAADPDQLEQVLVNLLLNGIHACAPGGRVSVRARIDGEARLLIEVEDDGAGIPGELRNRVFDPFFTTKKRGRGTGLGLTVAARLVQNHGGEIVLDSVVGEGTRVRLGWPLARGQGAEDG